VLAFPLLWQALQLIRHGQYVSQTYQWRSAPRGIDLLAPLLGHPFHPMTGRLTSAAFTVMHLDRIEGVAWIGMVPLVVLLMGTNRPTGGHAEARLWWAVVCVFALWSAGPYLTIAGFDTGLRLPEILMRFVPFVSNARVPGRAMVVVYLALGVLTAIRLAGAPGRLSRPALQWTFVVLLAFEFLDAPILLTMLDRPPVYARLAEAEMGAVCEAPFGIGDGLGGVGSQDRATLYYATIHQHPLVGGYIGRMPPNSLEWYARSAVVSVLLRLSVDQRTPLPAIAGSMSSPCRYIVLNRGTASAALAQFVRSLPGELLVATPDRELYRLRDGGGAARHTFDR